MWESIWKALRGIGSSTADAVRTGAEVTPKVLAGTLGGAALLGLGTGYITARGTSPEAVANTTDKELLREALQTEIDVTTRKLAELKLRKARREARKREERPYDRFV